MIKILDCTLRDGGYVNNWEFSKESILNIIQSLIDAKIDIVECGFVSQKHGNDTNSTLFSEISQVNELLTLINSFYDTEFCIMINKGEYNLNSLPPFDQNLNAISMIRYAFHKKDWKSAIEDVQIMINKGYQVFVQAMVTLSYSDKEIIDLLEEINKYDVYAMYIVDSFGAMFGDDFRRLHYLFENNLKSGIRLGYHSHNNLQLAYSNAIDFIQTKNIEREIIIDSSIHGMGRGAGNLTTELVADYMNKKKHAAYNIVPMLESIDKYLAAIYKENYWGYSIAHFLSASFGCHPNYATYLLNKKNLPIVEIQKILGLLDNGEKKNYNYKRIEELYINFKSRDGLPVNFKQDFLKDKNILILAPGPNAINQKECVKKFIDTTKPIKIAVNHIPSEYNADYYFFSNQKRYEKFIRDLDLKKVIITSNIHVVSDNSNYMVVDYHDLVTMTSNKNDNVTILLLNLLIDQKVNEVYLAGFDGYIFNAENYSYTEYDRVVDRKALEQHNENVKISLKEIKKRIIINYLTDSIFQKD